MTTFLVDPTRFHAEGALVDWQLGARRLGIPSTGNHGLGSSIQLRWMLNAELGLPTEPFVVWTRVHSLDVGFQTLTPHQQQLQFAGGATLIEWAEGPVAAVRLQVTASSNGTVFAFSGAPVADKLVAVRSVTAGTVTLELAAGSITTLLLTHGLDFTGLVGMVPAVYANRPGWEPVEIVGLPVNPADWGTIGKYGEQQGLNNARSDAINAAIARLKRGAPPIGWSPFLAAGVPAPAWQAPDPAQLVQEVNSELLTFLRDIAAHVAPAQQAAQNVTVPLPPPQNSAGQFTNKPGSTTDLQPWPMTLLAAASDPFLSLALGFGTAYPPLGPGAATAPLTAINIRDFMITARWEKGLDGNSAPVDCAAIISAPPAALVPATPANPLTDIIGALRPFDSDLDWRESVRVSWDRPPLPALLHTASFALARAALSPHADAVALMSPRTSGGLRPIVIGAALTPPDQVDPQSFRIHAMDRELAIPSNPGTLQLKYGAATQDIWGQWSPWVTSNTTLTQPDLAPVRLSNVTLAAQAPPSGTICSGALTFDLLWDWRIRTPAQITVLGRLFAAASHGDPPPNLLIPAGLDRALGGASTPLTLTFAGDTPSAPGAVITALSEDGATSLPACGPAQGLERRYRVVLSGLALDFASTPFIGIALWSHGQERIAPQRLSPFSDSATITPVVVAAADPRPPLVPVFQVTLASLPDASGASHAHIAWAPQPTASGYFIYEAHEADLLAEWGLPEPRQSDTLEARLAILRANFQNQPVRRPFTRTNSRALTSDGSDVTLPRGSSGIHLYVVLGISAGQVEGEWPKVGNHPEQALIAVAAPHITRPAPPQLEVRAFLDTSVTPAAYAAQVLVTTRRGPRPAMVELYRVRVDDAASELDTMGPPIARLSATAGPWTVNTVVDPDFGTYVTTVDGKDTPTGSWKRVWYRAAAWTRQDDARGGLPGRSDASNAAWVVLPPADGPVLGALSVGGGGAPADLTVQWTCASPRPRTPLGPHRLTVRAGVPGIQPASVLALDTTLDALPQAAPASGSGVWVVATAGGVSTYRALLRRAAVGDALNLVVRITDPLGRDGVQTLSVAAGPVDPAPDLGNLQIQHIAVPIPVGRTRVTFTSSSPILAPLDGPYVLRVTAIPLAPQPFPHPSISLPLGGVPIKLGPGPTPGFVLLRSPFGPPFSYEAIVNGRVKGFVVRITGPDGQFVEQSA